ncbi:MAG TPA: adenosylcobinamide-GDP ribazoletransferase [Fibrobacteraceae bacterium]|nr:adenosylcobinamide-GDP ribazoletransferase [Fibrobacteraceae bacterium]
MKTIRDMGSSFVLALMWFTRIPLPIRLPNAAALQQQSLAWLPLVGALVAGILWIPIALPLAWPLPIRVLLALALSLCVTGALHEDGWADGWDALGSGGDTNKLLKILKDPRLGTFGVSALLINLGLQGFGLFFLAKHHGFWLLLAAQTASRYPLALIAWTQPYLRREGEGKSTFLRQPVRAWAWILWSLWIPGFFILCVTQGPRMVAVVLLSLLTPLLTIYPWKRLLGGVTGDLFGFCQQSGLLAGLLAACWGLP